MTETPEEIAEDTCQICGKGWREHQDLTNRGIINHEFSRNGELTPVDRSPKKKQQKSPNEVMVVPGVDLLVRRLLVEKGVLSEADLADAGAIGYRPPADPSGGPEDTTQ